MEIPEPTRPLNHHIPLQVRFNDFDAFGHINNNVYLEFFDLGKALYFNEITGCEFDPAAIAAVVVNINCNFYAPTRMGEELEVQTACTRLGDRSLTLEQRIVNPATGSVKSAATTVMAGFDLETQGSAPINPRLREALIARDDPARS